MLLILVRDLMSVGPIRGALIAKGQSAKYLRNPSDAATTEMANVTHIIADLNLEGVLPALAHLKSTNPNVKITGFLSHVDAETAKAAREAGIDKILARSAFFKDPASFLE